MRTLQSIYILSVISARISVTSSFSTSALTSIVPSGVVAVFKPIGWTSSDVVNKVKYILVNGEKESLQIPKNTKWKSKVKVGHGGTLDPLAEGVLVLGIGSGTKLMQGYLSGGKGYSALALLGSETDTQDSTGKITDTIDCSKISSEQLLGALDKYRGQIKQMPPMYSALKQNGTRLYDLARQGIVVERELRAVTVYQLQLVNYELPEFGINVECSGGLYVRTLIVDLARTVGGRAHMTKLLRTKQGTFDLDDCIHQVDWTFERLCEGIRKCSAKQQQQQTENTPT